MATGRLFVVCNVRGSRLVVQRKGFAMKIPSVTPADIQRLSNDVHILFLRAFRLSAKLRSHRDVFHAIENYPKRLPQREANHKVPSWLNLAVDSLNHLRTSILERKPFVRYFAMAYANREETRRPLMQHESCHHQALALTEGMLENLTAIIAETGSLDAACDAVAFPFDSRHMPEFATLLKNEADAAVNLCFDHRVAAAFVASAVETAEPPGLDLITTEEVAQLADLDRQTIYNKLHEGGSGRCQLASRAMLK